MRRAAVAVCTGLIALSAGNAFAGTPNDDDNDYEGRAEGQHTYFGFDLSANGKRVSGVTALLHYDCGGGKEGNLLIETEGELKVDDEGKFSGKTTGESKLDVTFKTSGKLGANGKAHGTIAAKGILGPDTKCPATNDGDWNAKEGRDIDVELP